jgi:hypothetical protein
VKLGSGTGIITKTGVMCYHVLIREGYVRGDNAIEPRYNNFPIGETKTSASFIINTSTIVEWKDKKGTVQGTRQCLEIEITPKSGEPYKIYRSGQNITMA